MGFYTEPESTQHEVRHTLKGDTTGKTNDVLGESTDSAAQQCPIVPNSCISHTQNNGLSGAHSSSSSSAAWSDSNGDDMVSCMHTALHSLSLTVVQHSTICTTFTYGNARSPSSACLC
jgi:hypothetical protein